MAKCPAWREGNKGFEPRCFATKEMEACECLGNEAFCDFYPEKRKAAIRRILRVGVPHDKHMAR